jgi:glutamate carboxypeptidase
MTEVLARARALEAETTATLREFVECESPSDDPAAVGRFMDLLASRAAPMAKAKLFAGGKFGPNLMLKFDLPGPRKKLPGRILGVGHGDTVFPVGTLRTMPWREADGRLLGPGVFDMKGGLAFFLAAMKILRDLDMPVRREVALWVVSDEEVGSEGSRALTEKHALSSSAVLLMEPAAGLDGKLKTARKGVGDYTLTVRGKAAHAGVDFAAGASAIVELARQIEKIAGFTDLEKGVTVNPGVVRGGSRANVVAAEASCDIDIRLWRKRDYPPLDRKFRALKPVDRRCSLEVTGGLNRPPMERNQGVRRLFRTAKALAARHLGVRLEESATGGGSDGNFTAGLGIPTLDGLGAVGEGLHAPHESILVDRIADRTALIALLARELGR